MKRIMLCFALLSGCTAFHPTSSAICPKPIAYTAEQARGLSSELKAHRDLKYLPLFILDYQRLELELAQITP